MNDYKLYRGSHQPETVRCAMEWVAYLAGERHTDHPRCVDETLAAFCRELNDTLSDEDRQRLRPYLVRTIGTARDGREAARREIVDAYGDRGRITRFYYRAELEYALAVLDSLLPPLEQVEIPGNCAVDLDEFAKV